MARFTSWTGRHHSEETKRKISKSHKGKIINKETRKKMSEAHKGKKASIETRKKLSNIHKGKKLSEKHKKSISIANSGIKNHFWKDGKIEGGIGYIMKYSPNHPYKDKHGKGYVMEHRLVMEEKIGRYLKPIEVVHHIDKNRKNNSISNLILFENDKEHKKFEGFWNKLRLSIIQT